MNSTISRMTAQQIADTVKDICGYHINFINEKGIIIASSNPKRIDTFHEAGLQVILNGAAIEVPADDSFSGTQKGVNIPVFHDGRIIAAIGISGDVEEVRKYGYLAQRITDILLLERDLDSQGNQQKNRLNYIIRTLVSGDPLNPAYMRDFLSEYRLSENLPYRTLLIQSSSNCNPNNLSMIQQRVFQAFEQMDSPLYTFNYPNEYILLMSDSDCRNRFFLIEKLAFDCSGILKIGLGDLQPLSGQAVSCHAARLAIASLHDGQALALYDSLDFDLILNDISLDVKEDFLRKTTAQLSDEDIELLRVYFDENMSLQKTSSRLFIHKNSLQYRLNRIHSLCGYNPRSFQEAVVLYSAVKLRMYRSEISSAKSSTKPAESGSL